MPRVPLKQLGSRRSACVLAGNFSRHGRGKEYGVRSTLHYFCGGQHPHTDSSLPNWRISLPPSSSSIPMPNSCIPALPSTWLNVNILLSGQHIFLSPLLSWPVRPVIPIQTYLPSDAASGSWQLQIPSLDLTPSADQNARGLDRLWAHYSYITTGLLYFWEARIEEATAGLERRSRRQICDNATKR
jgi:hypothetical protein